MSKLTYRICPSIIAGDFTKLPGDLELLHQAGCQQIHMDIMDGNFVQQITFGAKFVSDYKKIWPGFMDAHLMVSRPDWQIKALGSSNLDVIHFHWESVASQGNLDKTMKDWINLVQKSGAVASLAINGPTATSETLEPYLERFSTFLVCLGKVGKAGQAMDKESLAKVIFLRKKFPQANIMVDIGLKSHTLPLAIEAGANWFVASSAIFEHPRGIGRGFEELHKLLPKT